MTRFKRGHKSKRRNRVLAANTRVCHSNVLSSRVCHSCACHVSPSSVSPTCSCPSVLANTITGGAPRVCFTTSRASGGVPICPTPASPHLFLVCGRAFDINLKDVREGSANILLARVTVDKSSCIRPIVKIDFSTIIEVEDDKEVELVIALKRTCDGHCTILQTYELEFDDVERLPFSFTFCDDDCHSLFGICEYTVEIIDIEVENGHKVDEIETESTAITAIVQR